MSYGARAPRSGGTPSARKEYVNLYEVGEKGYHSPLTSAQISELFYAGRLRRDSPCRLSGKPQWRTVDEIFPLLKYESASLRPCSSAEHPNPPIFGRREVTFLLAGIFLGGLAIAIYFSRSNQPIFVTPNSPEAPLRATAPLRHPASQAQSSFSPRPVTNKFEVSQRKSSSPDTSELASRPSDRAAEDDRRRSDEARQQREQLQRDQAALSEQLRNQQRASEEARQRAKGTDQIVELDTYQMLPVGSSVVRVKIHDNDVTSFDVWINGSWRREVKKEKGITASGTDETLIYSSGNARLYYVWEISGKLNHCRLRVRDS